MTLLGNNQEQDVMATTSTSTSTSTNVGAITVIEQESQAVTHARAALTSAEAEASELEQAQSRFNEATHVLQDAQRRLQEAENTKRQELHQQMQEDWRSNQQKNQTMHVLVLGDSNQETGELGQSIANATFPCQVQTETGISNQSAYSSIFFCVAADDFAGLRSQLEQIQQVKFAPGGCALSIVVKNNSQEQALQIQSILREKENCIAFKIITNDQVIDSISTDCNYFLSFISKQNLESNLQNAMQDDCSLQGLRSEVSQKQENRNQAESDLNRLRAQKSSLSRQKMVRIAKANLAAAQAVDASSFSTQAVDHSAPKIGIAGDYFHSMQAACRQSSSLPMTISQHGTQDNYDVAILCVDAKEENYGDTLFPYLSLRGGLRLRMAEKAPFVIVVANTMGVADLNTKINALKKVVKQQRGLEVEVIEIEDMTNFDDIKIKLTPFINETIPAYKAELAAREQAIAAEQAAAVERRQQQAEAAERQRQQEVAAEAARIQRLKEQDEARARRLQTEAEQRKELEELAAAAEAQRRQQAQRELTAGAAERRQTAAQGTKQQESAEYRQPHQTADTLLAPESPQDTEGLVPKMVQETRRATQHPAYSNFFRPVIITGTAIFGGAVGAVALTAAAVGIFILIAGVTMPANLVIALSILSIVAATGLIAGSLSAGLTANCCLSPGKQ